mmetsp:Transcript_32908/g.73717  ORF Transcript_32908/g.73717 Transcript_32908/m.73717 type:complete len:369 (+) Transcript_32908:233-1339(+)
MGNTLSSNEPRKERSVSETTSERSSQADLSSKPQVPRSLGQNKLQTEKAIWGLKDFFEKELLRELNLTKISAPLILRNGRGLNDTGRGYEPVSFAMADGGIGELPRALSRWKRYTLKNFDLKAGDGGICVYMNGIRPDETELDETHSHYVDQWDWELPITHEDRTIETLKTKVVQIYSVLKKTAKFVNEQYGIYTPMPEAITFVHSSQLQKEYPELSYEERENQACLKYGAVFVIGIGAPLADGKTHGQRGSVLDDWSTMTPLGQGLNGDILVLWGGRALELTSMSIRVDAKSIAYQMDYKGHTEERQDLEYVQAVLKDELPQTVGGGIGISRVCMYLLQRRHIAEVQSSPWPVEMMEAFKSQGIEAL